MPNEPVELTIQILEVACRLATAPVGAGVKDLTTFSSRLSNFKKAYKDISEAVTENDSPKSDLIDK